MSIYNITFDAIKQMAAIEFRNHCRNANHPKLGESITAQLGLSQASASLAREHCIELSVAKDILIEAWSSEGHAVIERWDVRATAALLNALPGVLPAKYRNAAITSLEQDRRGAWHLRLDSDRPRFQADDAARDGYELICRSRTPEVLRENIGKRVVPLVRSYQAWVDEPEHALSPSP